MENFSTKLQRYISNLLMEFDQIPLARQAQLRTLAQYISKKTGHGEAVKITVICTHNSRRSHIGQLWLWAAAKYYGLPDFHVFSGGTEATSFFPSAVNAMRAAGFSIEKLDETANPTYEATLEDSGGKLLLFSKKFDHELNPGQHFAAIMVCTSADEACPFVPGAEARFSLPFDDPKAFDGTAFQETAYAERCRQIGREMFFAASHILS